MQMESIPQDIIKDHLVNGYLQSPDVLALRFTSTYFVLPTNGVVIKPKEVTNKRSPYWYWLYKMALCECYSCYPVRVVLFWMARNAGHRVVTNFVNSSLYAKLLRMCPSALADMPLGAAGQPNIRLMRTVRGAMPQMYMGCGVLLEACKNNQTNIFRWLIDVGDTPPITGTERQDICAEIGRNGNMAMARKVLSRDIIVNNEMIKTMVRTAFRSGNNHIATMAWDYGYIEVFDHEMLVSVIALDSVHGLMMCLHTTWPEPEDSMIARIHQSVHIARLWLQLDLPVLPHIRAWMATVVA